MRIKGGPLSSIHTSPPSLSNSSHSVMHLISKPHITVPDWYFSFFLALNFLARKYFLCKVDSQAETLIKKSGSPFENKKEAKLESDRPKLRLGPGRLLIDLFKNNFPYHQLSTVTSKTSLKMNFRSPFSCQAARFLKFRTKLPPQLSPVWLLFSLLLSFFLLQLTFTHTHTFAALHYIQAHLGSGAVQASISEKLWNKTEA